MIKIKRIVYSFFILVFIILMGTNDKSYALESEEVLMGFTDRDINIRDKAWGNILGEMPYNTFVVGIKRGDWIDLLDGRFIYDFGLKTDESKSISGYLKYATSVRNIYGKVVSKREAYTYISGFKKGKWIYFKENNQVFKIYDFGIEKGNSVSGYIPFEINIRDNINGNIIGRLPARTYVKGILKDGWIQFDYNGKKAWIYDFGLFDSISKGYTDRIMNIRDDSSPNSNIIGTVPKNTYIDGLADGDYTFFYYNGKYVYIYNSWLLDKPVVDTTKVVLVLDPGHGPGREYNRGGVLFNEGDQTFKFSQIIINEGKKYNNLEIRTTRPTNNDDPTLEERAAAGNGADIFLSIHTNAAGQSVRGVEIFGGNDNKNLNLGYDILNAWSSILGTPNRGYKFDQISGEITSKPLPGVLDSFYVFKQNTAKEKLLLESIFHTNYQDSTSYLNNEQVLAKKLFEILSKYYKLSN